jgi:glycosyltransferase 2 family protein
LRGAARALIVVLWLACGCLLLWLALRRLDLSRLGEVLRGASLWPLAVALVVDVLCVATKAAKWKVVLRPVGRAGLLGLQAAFYAAGAAAMMLPFRLDEFVRAYVAHRITKLPGTTLLGSMALERLLDFLALLTTLVALALVVPLPSWLATAPRVVVVIALVLAGGLVGLQLLAPRSAGPGPVGRLLRGLAAGSGALRRPPLLAAGFGLAAAEWLGNIVVVALVLKACGVALPWHGVLLLTVLSMVSYALPLAPAGIGVFEVATRLALPELYGVEPEVAVGVALMVHGLLLLPMAVVGIPVIVAGGVRLREVRAWGQRQADGGSADPGG